MDLGELISTNKEFSESYMNIISQVYENTHEYDDNLFELAKGLPIQLAKLQLNKNLDEITIFENLYLSIFDHIQNTCEKENNIEISKYENELIEKKKRQLTKREKNELLKKIDNNLESKNSNDLLYQLLDYWINTTDIHQYIWHQTKNDTLMLKYWNTK